jgi:hypothetical protein
MRKNALFIWLLGLVGLIAVGSCQAAEKLGKRAADPTAAILEAKKLCIVHSMSPKQDPVVAEACAELLGGCSEGAGGAGQ